MGQYRTSSNFYGSLWSETLTGSGEYIPSNFIPSIFEFDINPDTLNLTNVVLQTPGTPIPNSGRSGQSRRYHIGKTSDITNSLWWYTHTGLGIYTFYSPLFTINTGGSSWPVHYKYGAWDADVVYGTNMYFGAYYLSDVGATYWFAAVESKDGGYFIYSGMNRENTAGYASWSSTYVEWYKDWVLELFYGIGSDDDIPKIVRVNPENDTFSVGESSILTYNLVNIIGDVISAEPSELRVSTGTGWGYDEDTRELKYITGTFRTLVTVVFIDNGIEYRKNDSFYPADLSMGDPDAYTPGIGTANPSWSAGGGGNFGVINGIPESSDNVVNSLPGIGTPSGSYEGSVSNAGLFVHYAMNSNMLKVVGDWLWATDLGLIIAKEVLSILYGSPIESAISLMSYPFSVTELPGVVSNQQELYWGAHGAGFNATAITNPYATIDWGTVQLTEFWGNFLDYAPHTKLELYLPWCTGFVPIDPNECLPGSLRVVTNIELAKGTCLHNVIGNDGRVIATHTGTCGKQLPLTALDTSGKALALVSGAAMTAMVGGAAIVGGTTGAMYGGFDVAKLQGPYGQRWVPYDKPGNISTAFEAAKTAAGPVAKASKKPAVMAAAAGLRANVSVPRNGTFTGSTAGLGIQYPYLILSRPTQSVPAQYGHHYGYPSNIYAPLANIRGYTEIGEIHLNGFTCTDDELSEIDSLLKSGVIL